MQNTPLENKIEKELVKQIKLLGGICLKLIILGKRNFPDRTILLPGGYIVFAECKKIDKDLRFTQKWFIRKVLTPLGFKVYSVKTIEDINLLICDYKNYAKMDS
ncbi:MAG: VRR-NUC domain-containing protein [Gammaproteobacteria bacterium]|nr:VRR-NUC domain-containing protein [Gammaproteobacteria bacterium]